MTAMALFEGLQREALCHLPPPPTTRPRAQHGAGRVEQWLDVACVGCECLDSLHDEGVSEVTQDSDFRAKDTQSLQKCVNDSVYMYRAVLENRLQ